MFVMDLFTGGKKKSYPTVGDMFVKLHDNLGDFQSSSLLNVGHHT
jgi:hypothetical protein